MAPLSSSSSTAACTRSKASAKRSAETGCAVDADALGGFGEVRRGEQAGAAAGGAQGGFDHGAGGAFAVGAGDVHEAEPVLRAAQRLEDGADALQTEFGGLDLVAERVEELDRIGVVHAASPMKNFERRGDVRLHFQARHHGVEHAVLQQELAALEAFGQLLADGLLDDARAGEADQGAGFGDVQVAQHGVAGGDAAGGGVGEDADVGQAGLIQAHQRRRRSWPSASG